MTANTNTYGQVQSFELHNTPPSHETEIGVRQWRVRGKNFLVIYTELPAGSSMVLEECTAGSVVVLPRVADSVVLEAQHKGVPTGVAMSGTALAVVPDGRATLTAESDSVGIQILTYPGATAAPGAVNEEYYVRSPSFISDLPPGAGFNAPDEIRLYRMDAYAREAGRFGRIFIGSGVMVNLLELEAGPRDVERLSPHFHDDFEQCTITVDGEYVHHLRTPWSPRLEEWQSDQHIHCDSPAIVVIPPRIIHTSRGINDGLHQLIDVFAPPREDFLSKPGWVLNIDEFDGSRTSHTVAR